MLSYLTLGLFLLSLLICLLCGFPLVYALLFGLVCFVAYAKYRGLSFGKIFRLLLQGVSKSKNILMIFVLIGILTALWRACGTIPFIVYYGLQVVSPQFFVLSIFLLCAFVSFLLGTAFGTASTVGVICMILARIYGIDPVLTAGAIVSGIFFGDRASPMSSSASLVATLTETNLYDNIKRMFRTALVPFFLTCVLYQLLGGGVPSAQTSVEILNEFPKLFDLNWAVVLPAALILVLALFRLDVKLVMAISIAVSFVLCLAVQGISLTEILKFTVFGFSSPSESPLVPMISGGGLLSMLNVGLIVCISSSYFGILQETGMLLDIQGILGKLSKACGRFGATLVSGVVTSAFACNQTLAVMLTSELCKNNYMDGETFEASEFAIDLENTVILVAGLIPWSIAGSVPLATVGADTRSLLFSFYLFLVPVYQLILHLIRRKRPGKPQTQAPPAA